jgi:hypothetical protein
MCDAVIVAGKQGGRGFTLGYVRVFLCYVCVITRGCALHLVALINEWHEFQALVMT